MPSEKKNIHQRMLAIMEEVSYIQRGKLINNQYKGVAHDEVTAKIRPALIKHGVLALPWVEDHKDSGNRSECTMQIKFINVDNPEDWVAVQTYGYGVDKQDKGPGKAMSYAVKYALLKAFSLETGDDPEFENINHEPAPKPEPFVSITDEQHALLGEQLESGAELKGQTVDEYVAAVLAKFQVKEIKLLSKWQAQQWLDGIHKNIAEQEDKQ